MDEIWLAKYEDRMYPEDNQIFGAYATEQGAKDRIAEELRLARASKPHFPEMHTKNEWYYSVEYVAYINL